MFPIKSVLDRISDDVFKAKSVSEAKTLFIDYINSTKIKDTDKSKMVSEVDNIKSLTKFQTYFCNALLKFEGLGINKF
jgi:hypothetical protein